jgi:hypothetical protein
MFCAECGKPLAESFKFCPDCGKPIQKMESAPILTSPIEAVTTDVQIESTEPALTEERRHSSTLGVTVFVVFASLSAIVGMMKGFVPLYLIEALGWAGIAWYWHHKKTHSTVAQAIVIGIAVIVCLGEVISITMQFASDQTRVSNAVKSNPTSDLYSTNNGSAPGTQYESQKPDSATAQVASRPTSKPTRAPTVIDPSIEHSSQTHHYDTPSECPYSLPSGVSLTNLPKEDSRGLTGEEAELKSLDHYDGNTWYATLKYDNDTNYCVTMATVELVLNHDGVIKKERHNVVFSPLLKPGKSDSADVDLKIKTKENSGNVSLQGWHTVSVSGFHL